MPRARGWLTALPVIVGCLLTGAGPFWGLFASAQVPPGHPPTGGGADSPRVEPSGAGFTWTTPRGWVKETPLSAMRRAQYRVPGPGGDGQCVIFSFGPGQGGDATANVARWANQFKQPDGRATQEVLKTRTLDVGGVPVVMAEITGTFIGGMAGEPSGPERPNYMLLGAIAKGGDGSWFFRMTGPKATLVPQRGAFEEMIKSLKRGG